MATEQDKIERLPWWSWVAPLVCYGLLALLWLGRMHADAALVLVIASVALAGSVFAAVHHAEVVALRVGEPVGSIVLAIAVTVIEAALILSLMLSNTGDSQSFARDAVYSAVMIVLNGVVGLCLVVGGARHFEQTFQIRGAAASLGVLGTLATITLILPNYTVATPGPTYSSRQLLVIGTVSLCLYAAFLFVQSVRHRDYFLSDTVDTEADDQPHSIPSGHATLVSAVLLCAGLAAVVLVAKVLSYPLKNAILAAGLPPTFVGVVIAAVVLLPEGMAAVTAAHANRLQISLNLALGSALATIGLTIPVVAAAAIMLQQPLTLGVRSSDTVLLVLTLFIATLTLATGRTTVLQGAIHLVIFVVFLFLSAVP